MRGPAGWDFVPRQKRWNPKNAPLGVWYFRWRLLLSGAVSAYLIAVAMWMVSMQDAMP